MDAVAGDVQLPCAALPCGCRTDAGDGHWDTVFCFGMLRHAGRERGMHCAAAVARPKAVGFANLHHASPGMNRPCTTSVWHECHRDDVKLTGAIAGCMIISHVARVVVPCEETLCDWAAVIGMLSL